LWESVLPQAVSHAVPQAVSHTAHIREQHFAATRNKGKRTRFREISMGYGIKVRSDTSQQEPEPGKWAWNPMKNGEFHATGTLFTKNIS